MSECSAHHPHGEFDTALQALRASRLRVTAPRKAILEVLTNEHGPFTAEEVHERIGGEGCDLVTVYRSLAALEGVGLVQRCEFGDGSSRYEYNCLRHHHHHLICKRCHTVVTLDSCTAKIFEKEAAARGYTNVSHTLEVFGICPNCQGAF